MDLIIAQTDNKHNKKHIENLLQQILMYITHQIKQHNYVAFKSILHRLSKIPMKQEDCAAELYIIKYTEQQHGYKDTPIKTFIHAHKPRTFHIKRHTWPN